MSSRLTYVGSAQGDELSSYFAASDLGNCPSEDTLLNRARCPAKLADMMAAGLAVVAEDVGLARDYIEHLVSGYLVTSHEVDAFAGVIVQLLRDEKLRAALGTGARRRIMEEFNWPILVGVAERAYAA